MPVVPPIPAPPKGLDIHESRQSQLYAAVVTTYVLALCAKIETDSESVTLISIVRLSTLVNVDLHSLDLDWNFTYVGVWTITESNMAIVSACLPSLKPILSLLVTGSPNPSSYGSSKRSYSSKGIGLSSTSRSRSRGNTFNEDDREDRHTFVHLYGEPEDCSRGRANSSTIISGGPGLPNHGQPTELKGTAHDRINAISVQKDVNVNWQEVR
ncbi:MAG: hypothetical protein Q9190_000946 [Brigantiaea leucoxantha]